MRCDLSRPLPQPHGGHRPHTPRANLICQKLDHGFRIRASRSTIIGACGLGFLVAIPSPPTLPRRVIGAPPQGKSHMRKLTSDS